MANTSKRDLMATLRKEHRKKATPKSSYPSTLMPQDPMITNTVDEVVFGTLHKHGSVTRSKLVEITGLPRTTLYDSLMRLILKGIVRKFDEKRNRRGRPKVFYQLSV